MVGAFVKSVALLLNYDTSLSSYQDGIPSCVKSGLMFIGRAIGLIKEC